MNTKELISKLKEKEMDEKLLDIYLDSSKLDYQRDRYIKAIERYIEMLPEDEMVRIITKND